jgi:hypothetical protein
VVTDDGTVEITPGSSVHSVPHPLNGSVVVNNKRGSPTSIELATFGLEGLRVARTGSGIPPVMSQKCDPQMRSERLKRSGV